MRQRKKYLTDMRISQSPLWNENTEYTGFSSSQRGTSNKKLKLLVPFVNLMMLLRYVNQYDCIISANLRTIQLLGLVKRAFRLKLPKLIALELMLDDEQNNICWNVKMMLQRIAFSPIDLIFVSAKNEIDTYSRRLHKSPAQIKFLPFHTNIKEPHVTQPGNYILSAGKSGRDYALLAAAVNGLDIETIVVGDPPSLTGIRFPSNVKVLTDVPYERYLNLLLNCRFVIIPLKTVVSSTGQVAFLEAMALGKPVIATDTVGTKDYIHSGVNGILVPPGNPLSLRQAIQDLLTNPALEKQIAFQALETVKKSHTFERYVLTILKEAEELSRAHALERKRNAIVELRNKLKTATIGRFTGWH